MRQRKLYQLLDLFSEQDQEEFQIFLENPVFNTSGTIVSFFRLWQEKVIRNDDESQHTVEAFLEGTDISRKRLDKLCSRLYSLGCEFLSMQSFEQDEVARDTHLLEAIESRGPGSKEALRQYEKMQADLKEQPISAETLLRSLNLRWKRTEYAIQTRSTRPLWQEDFRDLHHSLDQYYQLQKLKLLCASWNARQIFNQQQPEPNDTFLDSLAESGAGDSLLPVARAYFLTIRMMQAENGEDFFRELLALLEERAQEFDPADGVELYGYALNHCIRSYNRGELAYLRHTSALYVQLLDNKLILQDGILLPQQFKNIVVLHCQLGMLDWVETFIRDFGGVLPEESRDFALLYNGAVLAFYQEDYPKAIHQLKEVISQLTDDVFYGLDARVYLWKSYFEHRDELSMEEVDEMFRLYDSFRLFIERNEKISGAHKLHYRNFIREFKRFMEILRNIPFNQQSLLELRGDVSEMEFVSNKPWLLEKIGQALDRTQV